jgi:hypothetical protein
VKELPDVAVGLEDTRPSLGLDILFEAIQNSLDQRSKGHHHQDLNYIEKDSIRHPDTSLDRARSGAGPFTEIEFL